MGLLLKLENGDTALKSLKFGRDRLGNGSSNQPYIKNPIIEEPGKLGQADNDFLLRGGLRAPINAAEDVARLTKYMFDFKSPSGLLFIAKQNLLSRTAVATEASISAGYGNNPSKELAWTKAPINQGIYTPLSTLLQAGIGFTGTHLNLLGINPFTPMTGVVQGGFLPGLGLVRYEDVVRGETRLTKRVVNKKKIPIYEERSVPAFGDYAPAPIKGYKTEKTVTKIPVGQYENRLLYLWEKDMVVTDNAGGTILTYSGGPGSILGVGKTKINFADQRTGLNNKLSNTEPNYFYKGGTKLHEDDFVPNYSDLLGASKAENLSDTQTGIDSATGIDSNLYGPHRENYTLSKYNPTGKTLSGYGLGGPNNIINSNTSAFTGDSDEFYQGVYNNYLTGIKNSPTDRSELYVAGLTATRKPLSYSDKVNYRYLLGASNFQGLSGNKNYLNLEGQFISIDGEVRFFGPHLPNYTLSKYNPTDLELTGYYGYQLSKPYQNITNEEDTTYSSSIERILNNIYDRQLLSPPQFDANNVAGDSPTFAATSNGKFIPKYSSDNTLRRDYTNSEISSSGGYLWVDFNNPSNPKVHKDGYLADLDKNAGSYKGDQGEIIHFNNGYPGGIAPDFRLTPREKRGFPALQESAQNPDVTSIPKYGKMGKGETYSRWITDNGGLEDKTLDRIYYNSNDINKSSFRRSNDMDSGIDLIDFKIEVLNPTSPSDTRTMRFRAYIDSLNDSYNAEWKSQTYVGRGEKFWKYNAFDRDMSLGFTVVADSAGNLGRMYTLLDALASTLAPTYSGQGYMSGNIHKLTIGDYVSNQYGIITSLTYDIIDDSPWELTSGIQLPFYIKVTGFKFIPIHDFRPSSIFNHTAGFGHFIWPSNPA
jgi:hypothetical protein